MAQSHPRNRMERRQVAQVRNRHPLAHRTPAGTPSYRTALGEGLSHG